MKDGMSYTVKDWFANKIAQEVGRSIHMCDVWGILKETEKAVYAVVNLGADFFKTMWIPKSVLVESEVGADAQGCSHYETRRYDSYEQAVTELKNHWNLYK